jgi:hypothetical protein
MENYATTIFISEIYISGGLPGKSNEFKNSIG